MTDDAPERRVEFLSTLSLHRRRHARDTLTLEWKRY